MANRVLLIDVQSGDLFTMPYDSVIMLPMIHPDTGEATLLRATSTGDGTYGVADRDKALLDQFRASGDEPLLERLASGQIQASEKEIRRAR